MITNHKVKNGRNTRTHEHIRKKKKRFLSDFRCITYMIRLLTIGTIESFKKLYYLLIQYLIYGDKRFIIFTFTLISFVESFTLVT